MPFDAVLEKVDLQIGAPLDVGTAGQSAACRVDGTPAGISATLIRVRDRWTFIVHARRRSVHGEWSSKTKEGALEDLRNRLQSVA